MESADREVLTVACQWLEQGHRVYLATVVRTWGSSPRPVGSLLAVCDDARFAGSVSGGCVEDDLAARLAAGVLSAAPPRLESYGVTDEQTHRFGLPCGGRLDLVVEAVTSAGPLRAILRRMDARELIARRLCLSTGEASLHPARRDQVFEFDGDNVTRVFGPVWRLLLIGAGQLSRHVAEMALALDYHVIVCDPREEYAAAWRVAAAELDARMPDEAVRDCVGDARSAVIALTHDPKLDDMALMEALESTPFYVGALGSKANNAKRCARLKSLGVPESALARLHGPVGLPIGSRTPAEIAVAILAELTAVRHGIHLQAAQEQPVSPPVPVEEPEPESTCETSRAFC
ncbi:MAG TPA: XdhC family protein [Candidatus Methylomirabilis sp.]|nr:XdhC family protein [Candidatus Methylomirabilis sp.]